MEAEVEPGSEDDESRFADAVDRWVLDAVRAERLDSFDDLICQLPGVYPTAARDAVDRLAATNQVGSVVAARLRRRSTSSATSAAPARDLPVPHPLDYDWRFSASAVDRLVDECERRSDGSPVTLLGAPTVLWALRERESVRALLLDANPAVVGCYATVGKHSARRCEFGVDPLPALQSFVVVLDPPWYREHERLFFWAAAQLCRPGGTALVSMPPEGTRPGAAHETEEALRWAREFGLEVESREPGALSYLSPPFERNALRAAGLDGLPTEWRRGDLVVLRATGRPVPAAPPLPSATRWAEVSLRQVRLRIRPAEFRTFGRIAPQLKRLVPGDVLDAVSRRDDRRDLVDLWTSGNRIFSSDCPLAMRVVLEAMKAGDEATAAVEHAVGRALSHIERRNVRSTVRQVGALVSAEAGELASMGWAA